tara:strand:+ start:789 stop:1019 length:231 start_codon:yes stop_codon:yes gene_type:complete
MIGNNFIMKDPLDSENAKELEKKMNDPFTKKLDISMDKIHLTGQLNMILKTIVYLQEQQIKVQNQLDKLKGDDAKP